MTLTLPALDWYVEVDHSSGATRRPDVVGDAAIEPRVNDRPQVRIPVRKSEVWEDDGFEEATVRAWYNGDRVSVDYLADTTQRPGATELVCEGGLVLGTRLDTEVDSEAIHTLAEDLITNNTGLTANVDAPDSATDENVVVQSADTNTEFDDVLSSPFADDVPLEVRNGNIEPLQTCFTAEAEDLGGGGSSVSDSALSGGSAESMFATNHSVQLSFTTEYEIPAGDLAVGFRWKIPSGNSNPGFNLLINDTEEFSASDGSFTDGVTEWESNRANNSSTLSPGSHTITFEVDIDSGDNILLDLLTAHDTRYPRTFDNSVDANGYLSSPKDYPDPSVVFAQTQTPESVTGGRVETTPDAVTSGYTLELSNDGGATYPLSATNQSTLEGDFASPGQELTFRVTLPARGSRTTATPTEGYLPTTLDAYTLKADLDAAPIVEDRRIDRSLREELQSLARDGNAVWEFRIANDGTKSVEWTRPGQRTTSRDAGVADFEVTRSPSSIVDAAVVKGSGVSRSGEEITADHGTAVSLDEDELVPGSATLYDPDSGTAYDEGTDYRVSSFANGEVTTLSGGSITDSATVAVDYRWRPVGQYKAAGVADYSQADVYDISGLTTERACELFARRIVDDLQDPRIEATVTIPNLPPAWSVINAISPSGLPDAGAPYQLRKLETVDGVTVASLESRQTVQERFEDLERRVSSQAQR